ncbi:antiviral RADAR system adenosine deaminase RdrB [Brenneria populi subsp. brevivirga]|uniref:antiviral RADAR system adenosine deaminase RdrB n=1 Tax=Brenneria populi TaxID=1505588 RepID=UPI002E17D77F|nr:antiviral RADAR system adenosine deaminase RdrB [Brenneria populi subsp. brevivirga]
MYTQDPRWLVPCAYLASDRLFHFYFQQHANQAPHQNMASEEARLLALAVKDYQFSFGNHLRKEDIISNLQQWLLPSARQNSFSLLARLADTFLIWQGNCFEVRQEHLDAWLKLCSVIDPAWIIACAYVQLVQQQVLDEWELVTLLTERQCPFAFPANQSDTSYADNHVHFNGHGYTSLSMLSFVMGDAHLKPNLTWPQREEYRLFESERLKKNHLPEWISAYTACLLDVIYSGTAAEIDFSQLGLPERKNWFLRDYAESYGVSSAQQLLLHHAASPTSHPGHQRWLLFCCGLMLQQRSINYKSGLANLIRVCMILRNYMVVSAVGLGQFVEFFGTDVRRADNSYFKKQVVRYDLSATVSREYRVSPDAVIKNLRRPNIYHHTLLDFFTQHQQWHVPEQAHLVVHFTRSIPKNSSPHDKRWQNFRTNLLQQVRAFEKFSASVTLQYVPYQPNISEQTRYVDVRRLVRGYDVAGNENELPIEVFAPVLRVLRAAKHPAGMFSSNRLSRPFITVHAGEDYSHLLSGLRAIDEAVEFCQLREGDRIGHGLALGINITLWAQRQRRAYLTAGQHLDNLVWAYHQAVQLSQHTVEHIPVMHQLRDKIHHWSQQIFNDIYTPNQLYRAWLLRRNWIDYQDMQADLANSKEWAPDIVWLMEEQHDDKESKTAKTLWQRYLNSGLEGHEQDWINRIISVNCQPDAGECFSPKMQEDEDLLSSGEIQLYEAIQDFLMEKYSRLGLVIEACPTSNIYIGRLEKYHEHPLFRWNPPQPDWLKPGGKFNRYGLRSGPLSICINTDDSALMPTTIANEHRIMRETVIRCFDIGSWMADAWISAIREKGVSLFKANHIEQKVD